MRSHFGPILSSRSCRALSSAGGPRQGGGARRGVQRVRALLRPFILAVHPDRHHSAPADVRALNEESLKRLNGFFDLAEAQSTVSARPTPANKSEPTYTFAFGGIATVNNKRIAAGPAAAAARAAAGPAGQASPAGRVSATAAVPAELRGASGIGRSPSVADVGKRWTHITARLAVDLMEDAGTEVPEELSSLLAETTTHEAAAVAAAAARKRRRRPSTSAAHYETGLTPAQVLRMTLDHIDDATFEPKNTHSKGRRRSSPSPAAAAAQTAANAGGSEEARRVFVQTLFESQRVTVGPGMEESPGAVLRGAQRLREVLLEHFEELGLDEPRWSFVFFILSPSRSGQTANTFTRDGVVFVQVPCEEEDEGGAEETEAHTEADERARRRALLGTLRGIAEQRDES